MRKFLITMVSIFMFAMSASANDVKVINDTIHSHFNKITVNVPVKIRVLESNTMMIRIIAPDGTTANSVKWDVQDGKLKIFPVRSEDFFEKEVNIIITSPLIKNADTMKFPEIEAGRDCVIIENKQIKRES